MSYLLLASNAGNFSTRLAHKLIELHLPLEATFITTAANPYSQKEWMESDIRSFENENITVTRIDFAELAQEKCIKIIHKSSVLIVGGGNPIYLLEILQQKNLLETICSRVTPK